jgi:hypothetical protein
VAYQSVDLLEVWAWGQRVGAVARNPEGALSVFQYTPGNVKSFWPHRAHLNWPHLSR